jgi:uncharacterized protein YrrD
MIGAKVRNSAGEGLGKVEDVMIDLGHGRIAYAVLSLGGFLGIGNKLFAIPWNALKLNPGEEEFILDVDKKVLEKAPGFDRNNWPDMSDRRWGQQICTYYGYRPYWDANLP